MLNYNRRSTTKVKDGRVQKKNRHALTPNYWNTTQPLPVIDKERAGRGYKHLLSKNDVYSFIEIIPEWEQLAKGLDAILLASGEANTDGWYSHCGVVAICAWERDLWQSFHVDHFHEHRTLLERLEVESEKKGQWYRCKFTLGTARAYQLLHIFLHELGHHHDLMTTQSKRETARGETYAEQWALKYELLIWENYLSKFGLD